MIQHAYQYQYPIYATWPCMHNPEAKDAVRRLINDAELGFTPVYIIVEYDDSIGFTTHV